MPPFRSIFLVLTDSISSLSLWKVQYSYPKISGLTTSLSENYNLSFLVGNPCVLEITQPENLCCQSTRIVKDAIPFALSLTWAKADLFSTRDYSASKNVVFCLSVVSMFCMTPGKMKTFLFHGSLVSRFWLVFAAHNVYSVITEVSLLAFESTVINQLPHNTWLLRQMRVYFLAQKLSIPLIHDNLSNKEASIPLARTL